MSLPKECGPTLASVIGSRPGRLTQWESFKISPEGYELLTQLHAFWGKSMVDEEHKWRKSQPPIPMEETGFGNGGDESMDVDVSEGGESDDDYIAGCYSLEINIDRIRFPKIWIRAEYIRIYAALEACYQMPVYPYMGSAIVITGQPGIGKSVWIYYALRRRLAERKPVIWYYRNQRYLFVEEGVYKVPDQFHDFEAFVWTLVDSDENRAGVPENLVMPGTYHFLVYCTSPNQDRWSRLHKTVRTKTFIMNPWKSKEIHRVISTLPSGTILHENPDRVFDELGPTPRLCIDYLGSYNQIKAYRQDVRKAISNLATGELLRLLQDSCSLKMDAISHKICVISREDRENLDSELVVSPITPFIKSRLANHFRKLQHDEQIRSYETLSKVPSMRATAGIFFEAAAQRCLQHGVTLELLPMVRLPSSQGKKNPQWYSSHVFLRNENLEEARLQALQERQSLEIPRDLPIEEYTDNGPSSMVSNTIYVPELTNQVALDSFILTNDLLYIFQFSIGQKHDIKPGLIDFIRKCPGSPPMDKCCFIFIHPPNHTLVSPQPRNLEMQGLHPCSAVLNFHK